MALKIFYILDPILTPLLESKKNEISPYVLLKGRKPNIGYFKVWGCLAYYKKTYPNKTKLGQRAIKCAFVGYASNSKAYRLLDLKSNVIIDKERLSSLRIC